MAVQSSRPVGLSAVLLAIFVNGIALANPEAGGDYSQTFGIVNITSSSSTAPTILRSVTVKCPVAGFLIANADAEFGLGMTDLNADGTLAYGISRTTALDFNNYHFIEGRDPVDGVVSNPGGLQRFDICTAGQTITYRFVAYLVEGLGPPTGAHQPRLSVIFLRDRD